jgi:hypothetical protein
VDDWHCGIPGNEWRRREIESAITTYTNSSNKIINSRATDGSYAPVNHSQYAWDVVPACQLLKQSK